MRRRIRTIVERVAGRDLTAVLLFGSRARGDARADSDWDVAVMVRNSADTGDVMRRLSVELTGDALLWNEIVQPIVLRPDDMPSSWSLVLNLKAEVVAL